jgi:integrase
MGQEQDMTERGTRRSGNITKRGANSWRVKLALPKGTDGQRRSRYLTIRGTRQDAQKALSRELLNANPVASSRLMIGQYLERWLHGRATVLSAKSLERQTEIVQWQIMPFLGGAPLQGLRNQDISEWHAALLLRGGAKGQPLSRDTVVQCHRILYRALEDAVRLELVGRNPCVTIKPPRPAPREARSLQVEQVGLLLEALQAPAHRNSALRPVVILALATGLRRGEILGLRWQDMDWELRALTVTQSIEQTRLGGLAVKQPKTKAGRSRSFVNGGSRRAKHGWRRARAGRSPVHLSSLRSTDTP